MPTSKDKKLTKELGHGGVLMMNNMVNSSEFNDQLREKKGIKIFNKMRLEDASVNAALTAMFLPILSTKWRIDPADDTRAAQKQADFIAENLFDGMTKTWQETLQEVLLFLPLGCMPFELVWDFDDEYRLVLKKFASRFPMSIESFTLSNGEKGLVQMVDYKDVEIPIAKTVIFVNQKEGDNFWGRSILRSSYKNYYIKNKYYLIDAMAHERQGLGIPYAIKPANAMPQDENDMDELLANIGANEESRLIFPEGWEVGFMDMKAGSIKAPIEMIGHHDRQILKNLLTQFLDLGSSDSGSYALSSDHKRLFIQSIEAVANYVRDNFQQYVIKKMVEYNFGDVKAPQLAFEQIGDVDLATWTEALSKMFDKGVITPDKNIERVTRDHFDLPDSEGVDFSTEEIDAMLDGLENPADEDVEEETEEVEEKEEVTEEEVKEAAEQMTSEELTIFGGAKGVPLSEETKKKISEALKRRSKNKGSKKKKGKKAKDPALVKKKKEIKALKKQMKEYAREVRRKDLERKASGKKLNDQDKAKKELEVFNKKSEFEKQLEEMQAVYDELKGSYIQEEPPATLASKLSLQLAKLTNAITKRDS